jgi:DNA-directed RNA polymerase specialized sigma24 family protein
MAIERMEISGPRELERAQRYEHAALARIFDRHYDGVHAFIFALLGDTVIAEEVASLVFQRLLDALEEITGHGAGLEGWLYWTAYGLAVERRRRAQPEGVARALWELPPDEREVLALRLLAGLDVERVGAATGRSPAVVTGLQARGLRHLARVKTGG